MNTDTIIQASAQIVRITELKEGDVYKRVDSTTYGAENNKLVFGVVTSIMHNGVDGAICAIEIKQEAFSANTVTQQKVFTLNSNIAIFPAQPDELKQWAMDLQAEFDKKVADARGALETAQAQRAHVGNMIARALRGELTAPATAEGKAPALEAASTIEAAAEPSF